MKTIKWPKGIVYVALFLYAISTNLSRGQGTMISVSGPPDTTGQFGAPFRVDQTAATSWIETAAYSNVNISISLGADSGAAGMAYLTTSIGPGTTAANNEVASASFSFPSASSMVQIFSGLNLSAGTFYLTIEETASGSAAYGMWNGTPSPNLVTAANVIANGDYEAFDLIEGYAPAAPVSESLISYYIHSVTGTPEPVPEPSAICLFALGGGIGILGFRRKRV